MERVRVSLIMLAILLFIVSTATASNIIVVSRTARINESFDVSVYCDASVQVKGFECRLRFNQSILRANYVTEGRYFKEHDVFASPHMGIIDNQNGTIRNIYEIVMGKGNMSGGGLLFTVNFTGLKKGVSPIGLYDIGLVNELQYLPVDVQNGTVTVSGLYTPHAGQQTNNNQLDQGKTEPLTDWTSMLIIVLIIGFIIVALFGKLILG